MNISLITMTQGNVNALKRTIDSMSVLCDEIIVGDLFIFDEDRRKAKELTSGDNIQFIRFDFNYIYQYGFASVLNTVAKYAKNDMVIYMNVGEIISPGTLNKDLLHPLYNCYSFNHATDPHIWTRCYNRRELKWSGLIHEIVVPIIPTDEYKKPEDMLFTMADTEKDMDDPFKAKVMNDVKEICYWNQYLKLVERPDLSPATHKGWRDWALTQYDSKKQAMVDKGMRLVAFETGKLQLYLDCVNNPDFMKEDFVSDDLVNFQGARKDVL